MTIREFAKATGVSTATVSRSLSETGRYSEETRAMILQGERPTLRGASPNVIWKAPY